MIRILSANDYFHSGEKDGTLIVFVPVPRRVLLNAPTEWSALKTVVRQDLPTPMKMRYPRKL